jgi:hypothetical protein
MDNNVIYVANTVDIDPDNFDSSIFGDKKVLSWRGIDEGLPELIEKVKELIDTSFQSPKFTWFIRIDNELKNMCGSYGYLLDRYGDFWRKRKNEGDEIAWHPHVNTLEQLRESYDYLKNRGERFFSVRIGEAFHSNAFMAELASYGFAVDSTALPGRARNDRERFFDWQPTPERPYFPSKEDYRVPGDDHFGILEVPMSMVKTKAYYDRCVIRRYFNLSYRHEIIRDSINELINIKDLVVTILHPSELLAQEFTHPLLSFDINTVVKNLQYTLAQAQKLNKVVKYITISEIPALVREEIIVYIHK